MNRIGRVTALLGVGAAALALTACGGEPSSADSDTETITITDSRGEKQVVADPDSVLVYDMGVLDTLHTLGVDDITGVAKGSIPDYLSEYDSDEYANVGDLFEPDLEAIPATEPDLIIVGGRSSEMHDTLADTFQDADVIDLSVDSTDFWASSRENIETLARIFDKTEEAEKLLAEYDTRIEAVHEQAGAAGTGLVVMTSAGEVTAYSLNSRFGFLHDDFGIEPATGQLGDSESRHGEAVSFEFIRKVNPDLLYVIDRDAAIGEAGESAQQILDNELVADTNAWQQDGVTYLDPVAWYLVAGGLTSLDTMISDIEASLT